MFLHQYFVLTQEGSFSFDAYIWLCYRIKNLEKNNNKNENEKKAKKEKKNKQR